MTPTHKKPARRTTSLVSSTAVITATVMTREGTNRDTNSPDLSQHRPATISSEGRVTGAGVVVPCMCSQSAPSPGTDSDWKLHSL
jgi:hypothetical protein